MKNTMLVNVSILPNWASQCSDGILKDHSHVPQSPQKAKLLYKLLYLGQTRSQNTGNPWIEGSGSEGCCRIAGDYSHSCEKENCSSSPSASSLCYFLKNPPLSSGEISHPHSPHAGPLDLLHSISTEMQPQSEVQHKIKTLQVKRNIYAGQTQPEELPVCNL